MEFAIWSTLVGVLLILMALSATVLARSPLSTALLDLLVGVAVGPIGFGLTLSRRLSDRSWLLPLRPAVSSMVITVASVGMLVICQALPPPSRRGAMRICSNGTQPLARRPALTRIVLQEQVSGSDITIEKGSGMRKVSHFCEHGDGIGAR
ncbi:hypothetical protein JI739_14420 [Ramlibacter sp. AW1]|uniref:Uncharacterized protein n=1 Tax=Ramlibacter aurantiacus TaxID=2801330 RepID=A0A937D4A9_9BURK|nr:hypothetical protein [Ramlibacter aurantiacus]MBL0421550.1 hypothetical protein [Ramlibacter aurantiacus]